MVGNLETYNEKDVSSFLFLFIYFFFFSLRMLFWF